MNGPLEHVAKWTGSSWVPLGVGPDGPVHALEVFDGVGAASSARLYAIGSFSFAGGTTARNIASWDGSGWSPLGSGLSSAGFAMTVHDDGNGARLYVGGNFTAAGSTVSKRIAKWSGISWSQVHRGLPEPVSTLTEYDDGSGPKLCIGGAFAAGAGGDSYLALWGCY